MDNENIKLKDILKPTKIILLGAIIAFSVIVLLVGALYNLFQEDFKSMAQNGETYSTGATVSATEGIVSYAKDEEGNYLLDENGNKIIITPEDVLEQINTVGKYLKDDEESTKEEKLEYLLNAELVTKFPYIEGLAQDKVNGVVKFYRYSSDEEAQDPDQEKYLLKFLDEEDFNNKLDAGDSDIFNYFTIDEEQQLVIACITETTKIITTDDAYLTEGIINERATDTYKLNEDGTFSTVKSNISKQKKDYQSIIENYKMPFNLLVAFLTQTGSYSFTKSIADLAYQSEISIGIYENESISEKWDEYNYKKRLEYAASSELDFSKVNTYNPVLTEEILKNIRQNPRQAIIAKLTENTETGELIVEQTIKYLNGTAGTTSGLIETSYINSISGDKITEMGDSGKGFTTKYYTKTISRTSVTIGTILADTWIAKWETKYIKEVPEDSGVPQGSKGEQGNSIRTIKQYTSSDELFGGSAKTTVEGKLKEKAQELVNKAINSIMNYAENHYSVSTTEMTGVDIRVHALKCNSCSSALTKIWQNYWKNINYVSDDTLLKRVQTDINLEEVKKHVTQIIEERNKENNKKELEKAKKELNAKLNSQITYTKYPTVAISDVNIKYSTTSIKNTTTFKKEENSTRTNEGEKIKNIFNNNKYYESKKTIMYDRSDWFWEVICAKNDTAKLEDILRYLFNIVTGTKDFGEYKDLDKLFKAFEPQELKSATNSTAKKLLREYICSWENETLLQYINGEISYTPYVQKFIDKEKTVYYVCDDGYGHPTVGFGVDIFNGGYYDNEEGRYVSFLEALLELGYEESQLRDMSGKTAIPVDVIDDLKEKRIEHDWNAVEKQCYRIKFNTISKVCVNFETL